MPNAPALETARLTLRGHTLADADASADLWADPEVTRHIGGRPSTREKAWARVLRYAGLWALVGYGYWAVRERASGRFVGEVGLADFRRDLGDLPPALRGRLAGAPEAGWVLAPWAQGRGYATEAVRAALAWGDAHLAPAPAAVPNGGGVRAFCLIAPGNLASVRVAERCGFREAARAAYQGAETVVFARGS